MAERRCLNRTDAADYCGLTPTGFDSWVERGILPGAIPGTHRWDRKAIDAALDKRSGLAPDAIAMGSSAEPDADQALQGWLAGQCG